MNIRREVRKKFHVHRNDISPYVGWGKATNRRSIAELLGEVGYNYGAEVGVAHGKHALALFKTIPDLRLICVDPWKAFGRNTDEKVELVYQDARKKLKDKDVIWKRKTSVDAAKEIEDGELDFVYIDGMHDFDNVMTDIILWTNKVKRKGIVAGHDFMFAPREGVVAAVLAYTQAHNVNELFITKDRKEPQSWLFIKDW